MNPSIRTGPSSGRPTAILLLLALLPRPAAAGSAVPEVVLPPAEVQRAVAAAPRKDRPFHFAVPVAVGLDTSTGQWTPMPDGRLHWALRIRSADARSLSLHLKPFGLPEGAVLTVGAPGGTLRHGPYGHDLNHAAGLWTPIVRGEVVELSLVVDAVAAAQVRLGVAEAYHGYRDWKSDSVPGKSGACNIDVVCPQGDLWREEIRSVARIQISGSESGSVLCSGQLVNNVRQDLTPFFLTADHCGVEDATGGSAQSVVFYFNYQNTQCGGSTDGDLSQTLTGSSFLADDVSSDFTLLQLVQSPPDLFNVYYAGWNVNGAGSECGVSIHHPSGDEKAISLFSTGMSSANVNIGSGRNVDTWQVRWGQGTTEQGSSGAGLWNRAHQLVGVLSGGNASCSQPQDPDFYGRLDLAWDRRAAANAQLKAHLDPDNTGRTTVPGRDPLTAPRPLNFVSQRGCTGSSSGGRLPPTALLLFALAAGLRRRR